MCQTNVNVHAPLLLLLTQQVLHLPPLVFADPHTAVREGVPHDLKQIAPRRSDNCGLLGA